MSITSTHESPTGDSSSLGNTHAKSPSPTNQVDQCFNRAQRDTRLFRPTRTVSIALPLKATHRSPLRSDEGPARVVIKNHTGPSGSRERLIPEYRFGLLRSLHGCGFRANVANVIPIFSDFKFKCPERKSCIFASFHG